MLATPCVKERCFGRLRNDALSGLIALLRVLENEPAIGQTQTT